jgi:hypothetical protein
MNKFPRNKNPAIAGAGHLENLIKNATSGA